jgi:hypothetical protein
VSVAIKKKAGRKTADKPVALASTVTVPLASSSNWARALITACR